VSPVLALCAALFLATCIPAVTPQPAPAASPTTLHTLATPVAGSPAAGICASFDGEVVPVSINVDVPDPRCVRIRPDQRLAIHNQTPDAVEIALGRFSARIEPGQTYTIAQSFGECLAPGVHVLQASSHFGPELWLTEGQLPTPLGCFHRLRYSEEHATVLRATKSRPGSGGK
jgi:hypothetical protein